MSSRALRKLGGRDAEAEILAAAAAAAGAKGKGSLDSYEENSSAAAVGGARPKKLNLNPFDLVRNRPSKTNTKARFVLRMCHVLCAT